MDSKSTGCIYMLSPDLYTDVPGSNRTVPERSTPRISFEELALQGDREKVGLTHSSCHCKSPAHTLLSMSESSKGKTLIRNMGLNCLKGKCVSMFSHLAS